MMAATVVEAFPAYASLDELGEALTGVTDLASLYPEQGIIDDIISYASPLTEAPDKYHLGLAIQTVGMAMGRDCYVQWGAVKLHPNLFVLLLGPSTSPRKSTAQAIARRMVRATDKTLLLADSFTPEALVNAMQNEPEKIVFYSEFARFRKEQERSYLQGLRELLTEIYDCPEVYARRLTGSLIEVERPFLSFSAASTLDWLQESLKAGDVAGGWLARFLIFSATKGKAPIPIPPEPDHDLGRHILDRLRYVRKEVSGGMLIDEEAQSIYRTWYTEVNYGDIAEGGGMLSPFFGRMASAAIKIAMIFHVAATHPGDTTRTISRDSMVRALRLIEVIKGDLRDLVRDELAFSKTQEQQNTVLRIIREHGQKYAAPISRAKLLRYARTMNARQIDDVLRTLEESEQIWVEKRGRDPERYALRSNHGEFE